MQTLTAIKSDGTVLQVRDEVGVFMKFNDHITYYHKTCEGIVFVIESIDHHTGLSKTGYFVVAHVKGHPERKLLGFKKEGYKFIDGIDADWFTKLEG